MPLKGSKGGGGFNSQPCPTFNFSFKRKLKKIEGRISFYLNRKDFSWEDAGTLLQNSYQPLQDHKLHCKEESYRFSG